VRGLTLITAPTAEPLTLQEVKEHCRVSDNADDAPLRLYAKAARQAVEEYTGRQLMPATWELALDGFPDCEIYLPKPPLTSVTSVKYYDGDGALQTLDAADYEVSTTQALGRVAPVYGVTWPDTDVGLDKVKVRYAAGYADAATVPAALKEAILLLTGDWYANRENVVSGTTVAKFPYAVEWLLAPYCVGEYR